MNWPSPTAEVIDIHERLKLVADLGNFDGPCVFVTLLQGFEEEPLFMCEYARTQNLHLPELDCLIDALTRKRDELKDRLEREARSEQANAVGEGQEARREGVPVSGHAGRGGSSPNGRLRVG